MNRSTLTRRLGLPLASAALLATATTTQAAAPPIRTSATNTVPACVTPDRLMQFLRGRNPRVLRKFSKIADWYKYHGESWNVRWDYAFYQMAIETNFLKFKNNRGQVTFPRNRTILPG